MIALVVIAGGAAALLAALRPEVRVESVARGSVTSVVSGKVEVYAEIDQPIESEVGGRLVRSYLEEGKEVRAGDVLAEIDPIPIQNDIALNALNLNALKDQRDQAASETAPERLALKNAQDDLAALIARGANVAQLEVQRARTEVRRLENDIELAASNRDKEISTLEIRAAQLERDLANATIRANFDGVIAGVQRYAGALLNPRTPLASLISRERKIEAKIGQENFAAIRVGQKAVVRFSGTSTPYELSVASILPTADPETQLYTVRLTTTGVPPELLVHGLFGEVDITVGEHRDVVVVPRRAVLHGEIFVVSGGRAERRTVSLGYSNLAQAEVTSGLEIGELVVVEGLGQIRDGQRVKVLSGEAGR